ncbi:MAG: CRISPR-associated helicase Cas3' [Synergistetes bacterium]|nr:CRISPR-associated helicase Cas3' [Synergistota bacterium]
MEEYLDDLPVQDDLLRKSALLCAEWHDLGKATRFFQDHLRGSRVSGKLSSHALLSAVLTLWNHARELPLEWKLPLFLAIKSHHSVLYNLEDELCYSCMWSILERQYSALLEYKDLIFPSQEEFEGEFSWKAYDMVRNRKDFTLYLRTNLLLGMLVDADIRAVLDLPANMERVNIPSSIVDDFVVSLRGSSPLMSLRREFYSDIVQKAGRISLSERLLSITAPTGIGKTLAGFSFALKLRNRIEREKGYSSRIIYVLPFTSIIDQNYEILRKVLIRKRIPERVIIKHHYRTDPSFLIKENALFGDYDKAFSIVETWDAEIIVSTFVQLFETIFSNHRSSFRRLHRLMGSILILDEVQNFPVRYWDSMEKMLKFLAEHWKTYVVLMTATRPALLREALELTMPKKTYYFENLSRTHLYPVFKERSCFDIEEWLLPEIDSTDNLLVIMNTVRSAQEVYKRLKEVVGKEYTLFYLSAALIPIHRENRIEKLRALLGRKKLILVSTQVVEAGIDIDFQKVIRDFAPLDSIIQSAGRCNRNAMLDKGKVVLLRLMDEKTNRLLASYIYDETLLSITRNLLLGREGSIFEKDYLKVVELYFESIREAVSQYKELSQAIADLSYGEVGMYKLIESVDQIPVFIEWDEEATKLVEILRHIESMSASSYEKRMKKRNMFLEIRPKLWRYIVGVPQGVLKTLRLGCLPFLSTVCHLPRKHPEFENIYSEETGFTRGILEEAIFL